MFLVSGIPRSGTTVIAGFLSLDENLFCYASESHLLTFLHHHFEFHPCDTQRIDVVLDELRTHLNTSLIDTPRTSISRGYGHTGYALIQPKHIDFILEELSFGLKKGFYGAELFKLGLTVFDNVLSSISERKHKGEKTPDNIFPIVSYCNEIRAKNFVMVREPFGVLRSMTDRIKNGYPHSEIFQGTLEYQLGIYLRFAETIEKAVVQNLSHLIRFEDVALSPQRTITDLYADFNITPSEEILNFVLQGGNQHIADRALMKYRRLLRVKTDLDSFSSTQICKISALTKRVRNTFGYDDESLNEWGFEITNSTSTVSLTTELIAMSGFYTKDKLARNDDLSGRWSNGQSRIIAYFQQIKRHTITIELLTNYPEHLFENQPITISTVINTNIKQELEINPGLNHYTCNFTISINDITQMGNSGYALIDIITSRTFCPLFDLATNVDRRRLAFQIINSKINAEF